MEKRNKIVLASILIILVFLLIGLLGFFYITQFPYKNFNPLSIISFKDPGYDFNKLKQDFPDVIGWIEVDGTNIKEPIVKEPKEDLYYMNHNASKDYDMAGAIFIQKCNNSNFTDPITLVYGHNMTDDRVFSNLTWFKNKQFFNDNEYFYIYKQHHKLVYKIIAAYEYDNRHIMNSFDFSDPKILEEYEYDILNTNTYNKNIRETLAISQNDRIVQLSTCLDNLYRDDLRYIVTGLLYDDIITD